MSKVPSRHGTLPEYLRDKLPHKELELGRTAEEWERWCISHPQPMLIVSPSPERPMQGISNTLNLADSYNKMAHFLDSGYLPRLANRVVH